MSYQDWIVIGILLSLPVALVIIWFQNRKSKVTKVSQQDKLAKAAHDVTKEHVEDVLAVFEGQGPCDEVSPRKLYRKLAQYSLGQWQKHEYGLRDSITTAAMRCNPHVRPEDTAKDIMDILMKFHIADNESFINVVEQAKLEIFLGYWLQALEESAK